MWFRLHLEKNRVGRQETFFFMKIFFLEYSDLLGNGFNKTTDIKGTIVKGITLF